MTRRLRGLLGTAALLVAGAATAELRALVVAGLGGTDDYETRFQRHAKDAGDALRAVSGDVTVLLGPMSRRDAVLAELADLGARSGPADQALLLLIGHGSYDERRYRFNLPGTDLDGADLAEGLAGLPAASQVVVAATSASGALQSTLAADLRTVVTATRSGSERNVSVFPGYFVAALSDSGADTDKDGYVSVAEAFQRADAAVAGHYAGRNEMRTEHPTLQGPRATVALARIADGPAFAAPQDDARLARLEQAIADLQADKANMATDAYYAELQRLLLELAMARQSAPAGGPP